MISKHLTPSLFEESTLSPEVFHAKTSAQQESKQDLLGKGQASGMKCFELLHKRDQLGLLLKTLLTSTLLESTLSLTDWKPWVTPQGRLGWKLPTLEHPLRGCAFSSWLARPVKSDINYRRPSMKWKGGDLNSTLWRMYSNGGKPARVTPQFLEWLMGFPNDWTEVE